MNFQIDKIILWSKNSEYDPRIVEFEPNKINIITGASRTGKSAIIPIIDYCLGSSTCKIPVNTIRDTCAWFGIVISTHQNKILIARKNPENQSSTSEMYLRIDENIEIPYTIEGKNANVKDVKLMLDELAGLSNLQINETYVNNNFNARIGFNDITPFLFQPQNIVANPDVFFFKADTYQHRQRLINIFPYVLNAITPEIMTMKHELSDKEKILERKKNELRSIKDVSTRWIAEAKIWIYKAIDYGIIKNFDDTDDFQKLYDTLIIISKYKKCSYDLSLSNINENQKELIKLKKEQSNLSFELSQLRKRLFDMSNLKSSSQYYQEALHIQHERLYVSKWFTQNIDRQHTCPLCKNVMTLQSENIDTLSRNLEIIEQQIGDFKKIPASFDREYERVRKKIEIVTEKLNSIQRRIESLKQTSAALKDMEYKSNDLARYLGNVQYVVQTLSSLGNDGELNEEIDKLEKRIAYLKSQIDDKNIEMTKRRALKKIETYASSLMPHMDTERPYDPLKILIKDLTIKVVGKSREDYLWEIGSGSNWLAYHIGITLSLQKFFIESKQSCVPNFVIYDQPSQVYFPKILTPSDNTNNDDMDFGDEEVTAVKKIFTTMSSVIENVDGNLQIIVLDHAPESVWKNTKQLHLVEEWRYGKKLIPTEWIY